MASTAEGRTLTEQHRLEQLRIAGRASMEARALWSMLKDGDLDVASAAWLAATSAAIQRRVEESQEAASRYLRGYSVAETGAASIVALGAARDTPRALYIAGPVKVKMLIRQGMTRAEAVDSALTKFDGIARRQTLMGGRSTIARTAAADRRVVGWRRVTDGNPCAFCALLASRGPVYQSSSSAAGMRYHGHCGCTAEPEFGAWTPNAAEAEYEKAYQRATESLARVKVPATASNVLAAMRRDSEYQFRDSLS